ncbi:MAG: EamA family transporter [Candidatus Nanoarchaeia archaeon]
MEFYIILALLGMFLFGINAILYKIAPNIDPITLTLVSFTVSAVGTFIYWMLFVSNKQVSFGGISIGILVGLTSVIALASFITALKLGKASVVSTIRSLSVLVTIIIAVIFLHEKMSITHWIGIVFGVIATVLLSS